MMKLTFLALLGHSFPIPRDNEGGDDDNGGGDDDNGGGENEGGEGKKFSQDEVNKIVVNRNKKLKAQYEDLERNYEGLLEQTNLTQEQRDKLENDLEQVRGQLRTKEQQAAHEAKKRQEEHQKALKQTQSEKEYYQNLFETSTKHQAITQAASKAGAFNPEQFIPLLDNKTKIVEELDSNGEKTGKLVPRVEVSVKGEDGKPTLVFKSPEEAVKEMQEDTSSYGNLFKSNVARGIGDGTTPGMGKGGKVDVSRISDKEYFQNRAEIRKNLGLRDKRTL